MATRIKWDINGAGVDPAGGMGGYDGPNLPKGSYLCKIKRMTVGEIKSIGENKGKPRISVLLEVVGPDSKKEYLGHPIWDGLNIIKSSLPFVNAFLHGLTDGSDQAKHEIEKAFWDVGPKVKRVKKKDNTVEKHVESIGNYAINSPSGELLVQVLAKPSSYKGQFKAEVAEYIPRKNSKNRQELDEDGYDEDEDDDIGDEDVEDEADADTDDDDYEDAEDGDYVDAEGGPF
jgi:hypothetical protein